MTKYVVLSLLPFFASAMLPEQPITACLVNETSSGKEKPCIFPFTFNNRIFTACTNFTDPHGEYWCSTKVNKDGDHVGRINAWGHCPMNISACRAQHIEPDQSKPKEDLNLINSSLRVNNNDSLGTWKPSADNDECGVRYTHESIVGGNISQPGEFPYSALLGYRQAEDKIFYLCGGSLINRFYVITAAHCHSDDHPINNVVLGEHVIGQNPDCKSPGSCLPSVQDIEVETVTIHENWNPNKFTKGNDIALVRLEKPATLFADSSKLSFVIPVCLPWLKTDPGYDLSKVGHGTITGWGKVTNSIADLRKNYNQFHAATRTLMKAEIPIADEARCKQINKDFDSSKQICAGGTKGVDSCGGDSGGPLVYRDGNRESEPWFLIGVISFGTKECAVGKPGVYTKVTSYLDWIEKNMEP